MTWEFSGVAEWNAREEAYQHIIVDENDRVVAYIFSDNLMDATVDQVVAAVNKEARER